MLNTEPQTTWEHLSQLRPSMAAHVFWHEQTQGGTTWFVLQNEATGEHARFNATAHAIISRLDGRHNLSQIFKAVDALPFTQCDQTMLVELMKKLQRMGALKGAEFIDSSTMRDEHEALGKRGQMKRWLNPLAVRINLFDPDHILTRVAPKFKPLFHRATAWVWCLVTALALVLLVSGWSEVKQEFLTRTLRVQTLWWFALLYPGMKVLHEFAHALCIKHWGGQVRDVGISFLLLVPVPYVDATDVYSSHTRRQRMILTAAGMCTELFIAAIALVFWFWVEPGYTRDALFSMFIIGGLTTLLFNANPLLKFDGYYLLQDALDIPNLAARATVWLRYIVKSRVFGVQQLSKPYLSKRESVWLTLYGVAVILYKPILTLTIIIFLWREHPLLGIVLAGFALFHQWLWPSVKGVQWLVQSEQLHGQRPRAIALVFCSVCVLATLLLIPLPSSTKAQGIVSASEQGEVFSKSSGLIRAVHIPPGAEVKQGDKLVTLINPSINRDLQIINAEIDALKTDQVANIKRASNLQSMDHATAKAERIRLKTNRDELLKRFDALVITAKQDGVFAPLEDLLPGRHVKQGERIGYVVSGEAWTIRTVVPENRAAQLNAGVRSASVRLAESLGAEIPAELLRETPAMTRELPSAALSRFGGGAIVTDPFDESNKTSIKNLFELELALPGDVKVAGLGQRALVRLEHPSEALLTRIWRATRSVWLTRARS